MALDLQKRLAGLHARLSLRQALALYALLPMTFAVSALGWVLVRALETTAEQRMQEDVQLVARAVRRPLSRALEQAELQVVSAALGSAFDIDRVYGAYLYDQQGTLLASTGRTDYGQERSRLSRIAARGDQEGGYDRVEGRSVYSFFVPLTDSGGRIIGLLQVSRRRREIESYLSQVRVRTGLLIALAAVGLGAVAFVGYDRGVGSHLGRLVEEMATVTRGQTRRVGIEGPGEIASLGRAVNSMLRSIERAEEEVDEHRRAEHALREELRHREKLAAIGTLATGIAHELGTPLSVIDGHAQRVLKREEVSPAIEHAFGEIRGSSARMGRLVRRLLDFARRGGSDLRWISAGSLCRAAVASVEPEGSQRGIRVDCSGREMDLHVDPGRIQQALTNLLQNAVQAADGRVSISWLRSEQRIRFLIDDDGPGVPVEIRSQVVEPFFTTKPVGRGTGLGLSIVDAVAEEYGGRLEIETSPLGGARFALTIVPSGVRT